MRWSVGSKIAAGFSFALVVFLGVGVLSYRGTSQLIEASEVRQRIHLAVEAVDRAHAAQLDIGLALRTYLLTGEEVHREALRTSMRAIDPALQQLRARTMVDSRYAQNTDKAAALLSQYVAVCTALAELRRTKGLPGTMPEFLSDETHQLLANVDTHLRNLQADFEAVFAQRTAQANQEATFARGVIVAGNALALVLAVVAGWLITRHIATPLRALTADAERITAGDLSASVTASSRSDEIGVLGRALDRMTQSLQVVAQTAHKIAGGDLRVTVQPQSEADVLGNAFARMSNDLRSQLRGLVEGVGVLSAAAAEIVASSSQLAASATQSAAAVSETSTTVEEVRHTAQLASQKAKLVSNSGQRAIEVTEEGKRSTLEVEAGMNRIRGQMDNIAGGMVQLSERNQAVGQVIAAVEDLATQSNMLAVNAAIEAAKAGEHGRGFSVVAQEVKNLAEQSRLATNQVRSMLGDIQKATAAAVMATEEGGKVVEAGARQAEVAGESVQSLGISVSEAVQAAMQIAASSQQQLAGMDQVATAMDSIKQASAQNVASAAQLESTARNISDLGQRLKQMVESYQV